MAMIEIHQDRNTWTSGQKERMQLKCHGETKIRIK
jgi:hypothetical protein